MSKFESKMYFPIEFNDCNEHLADVHSYLSAFGGLEYSMISIAGLFMIITLVLFVLSLKDVVTNIGSELMPKTIVMIVIYPVSEKKIIKKTSQLRKNVSRLKIILYSLYTQVCSICAFLSLLVPRAILFLESISLITYSLTAYQFVCLVRTYLKGDSEFIAIARSDTFTLRRFPICCMPWFHAVPATKAKMRFLRLLVLQLSIVLTTILIIQNILYAEDPTLYNETMVYITPFIAASILTGVWGLNCLLNMIQEYLPADYRIMVRIIGKYFTV